MPRRRTSTALLSRRVVLGLPILALAACGGDDDAPATATATPAPALSAAQVLQAASERLVTLPSLRFSLEIDGQTFVDTAGTIELLSATGALTRPNAVDTEFKVKVLRGLTFSVRMIVLGAERWTTDLVTGEWGPAPMEFDYDPGVIFDTANGLGPIMAAITGAIRGEDTRIFDRDCYRVDAVVDQAVIGPLTGNTMQGSPVTVELWIERASSDLLRALLREPATVEGRTPASWTLDLSDHGQPVTIERPVADGA